MGDTPRRYEDQVLDAELIHAYLPVVRGAIGLSRHRAIGWDESECLGHERVLAVDEALANIIRHAYHGRTDGSMELECREIPDGLEITLLDNGDAPDLSKICAHQIGTDQPGGPWGPASSRR